MSTSLGWVRLGLYAHGRESFVSREKKEKIKRGKRKARRAFGKSFCVRVFVYIDVINPVGEFQQVVSELGRFEAALAPGWQPD